MMLMAAQSSASSAWGPKPNSWNACKAASSHDRTAAMAVDWLWDTEWSSFAPRWGPKHVRVYRCNTNVETEWSHNTGCSNSTWGSSQRRTDPPRWNAAGSQPWNHNLQTPWRGPQMQVPAAHAFAAGWDVKEPVAVQGGCLQSRSASRERRLVSTRFTQCDRQIVPVLQKQSFEQESAETRCPDGTKKLPSVGSAGHEDGLCKRCAFFPKGRCKNGEDCTHCHLDHPKQPRSRRRRRARSRSLVREHEQKVQVQIDHGNGEGDADFDAGSEASGCISEGDEICVQFRDSESVVPHGDVQILDMASRFEENRISVHQYGVEHHHVHILPDVGHDQCEEASNEIAEPMSKVPVPTKVMETNCKSEEYLDEISTQAGTANVVPSVEENSEDDMMHSILQGVDATEALASVDEGSDGVAEDEADTEEEGRESMKTTEKAEEHDSQSISGKCKGEPSLPDKEHHKPHDFLPPPSAGSWAAQQRMRAMESGRCGPLTKQQPVDNQAGEKGAPAKPQHTQGLQISENSWAAQQRLRRAERESGTGSSNTLTPEEMGRKAKSLLNKLTNERFESLCQQILDLPLQTPEQLQALVAEIFDKATTERGFLSLYTDLCARLDSHLVAQGSCVGGKVFRKALVTECQACFERNLSQPLDLSKLQNLSYEERYEEEVKHKTRTIGNMRFIGDLLVHKLLAGKVLFFIVNEMLDIGNEAAMESLTELLAIVGPALEQKGTIYEAPLREVFGTMKVKSKDTKISKRMRCKICDLLDLRSRGWSAKSSADSFSPTKRAFDKTPRTPKVAVEAAATRRR